MATTQKYSTPALTTVMSTDLNSLADDNAVLSAEIDNTSNLYQWADFEIYCTSSNNLGAFVSLVLVESVDGTNFEESTLVISGLTYGTRAQVIGSLNIQKNSTVERHILRCIPIPPTKFKLIFINALGNSLASSGNTVKMLAYGVQNT